MKRPVTEGIVLHRTEVYVGNDYHLVILRNGTIRKLVDLEDVALHACRYNRSTIAVAIFGDFASKEPGLNWYPTTEQLDALRKIMKIIIVSYPTIRFIAGHSELGVAGTAIPTKLVSGHTCPGEHFPLADIIAQSGLKPLSST